jgi:hypothetical protein
MSKADWDVTGAPSRGATLAERIEAEAPYVALNYRLDALGRDALAYWARVYSQGNVVSTSHLLYSAGAQAHGHEAWQNACNRVKDGMNKAYEHDSSPHVPDFVKGVAREYWKAGYAFGRDLKAWGVRL